MYPTDEIDGHKYGYGQFRGVCTMSLWQSMLATMISPTRWSREKFDSSFFDNDELEHRRWEILLFDVDTEYSDGWTITGYEPMIEDRLGRSLGNLRISCHVS